MIKGIIGALIPGLIKKKEERKDSVSSGGTRRASGRSRILMALLVGIMAFLTYLEQHEVEKNDFILCTETEFELMGSCEISNSFDFRFTDEG